MRYMTMIFHCDGCGKEEKGYQDVDNNWVPPVGWSESLGCNWCPACAVDADRVAQQIDTSMHEHAQVAQSALSAFISGKEKRS